MKHVCILNTSNIHKNHLNLFWTTIHENQYQKSKRVCIVHLSISTILSFTNGSKHTKLWIPKFSWWSSSSRRLGPKLRDPRWVLCIIMMLGPWNHLVNGFKIASNTRGWSQARWIVFGSNLLREGVLQEDLGLCLLCLDHCKD